MSLLTEYEESYVETRGQGIDQFWIDYAHSLVTLLTWRNIEEELPEEGVTVWVESSRYFGAGKLENGEWFTWDWEKMNSPWRWMPISKESL